ncbi:PQQ-binding-like beta-propeller repeat protein [Dokdonella ginsengisoli]|uniref:PQQ-binding-like beta-propeller repeat protein n=1 Tax=Dokdonella ginsengisoli TaxID=363846 RepID=A0ABV9QQ15_9GAMM
MTTPAHSLRSALLLGLAAPLAAQAADWPQFGYDAAHSGFNPAESAITTANVAQLQSAYPKGAALPASVDSAPVYLSGVATANGTRNLLFLLSKNGRVMAVDANDGSVAWSNTTSGTQPTTASPAIDPGRQFVYAYGLDGKAHKYRVGDGGEITGGGWPQTISLKTNVEKGAGGFTVAASGGTHYLAVVTDGYIGDGGNYQGHLVSIDLASGAQKVFNTVCSDQTVHFDDTTDCPALRSGIWGRAGATFDAATNRFYIATGNGQFNANAGGRNWGDSVLALAADGSGAGNGLPHDSYTPSTYQHLEDGDIDLGSVSPAIVPVPAGSAIAHLGLQAGKDGVLRLIDLDDMSGQGGAGHVGGEVQALDAPQGRNGYPNDLMREQPAVWVDPADHSTWVFVGNGSGMSGLQLGLDGANRPMLTARWTKAGASNGSSSPVVANGVLFNAGVCASGSGVCVNARNPHTGDVLWSSPAIGPLHWQSPIVVDGAVYVTDNNAKLWKFALPLGDTIFDDGFDG